MNIFKRRSLPILVAAMVILIPSITYADNFLVDGLKNVLWTLVNVVFGWMVWAGGLLLNLAITKYVVGFGTIFENSGLGYSVNTLWATVRDIFNLTFIFGLVYIGFRMIFNSGDSNAKRMLGSLILAALLVNFSLFITKFIIDFSNIAATQFAQAFYASGPGTYAVSDGFMKLFGLNGMWNTGGSELSGMAGGAGFAYIFGTLFLYLIAAFVFFSGGLLLIIRFVVLNIYMILSPLMFLGFVFPGLSNISQSYWKGFLGRAFFAPAYILMLYFAHQVLVNMKGVAAAGSKGMAGAFATENSTAAAAKAASESFEGTIVFFIITAIFMVSALVVAQKMGAVGADNAMAIGKRLSGKARGYATNAAISTGRGAVNAATYAPRAGARMLTNKVGEWGTKKLNDGQTGTGRLAAIVRTNVADRFIRGKTTAMTGAQFGTGTTNQAEKDYKDKTMSRANQTAAENAREASFESNLEALNDTSKSAVELSTALDELGKSIKSMTKDEKAGLDLQKLTNKSVATNLSDDDIKNLEASGKFASADIQKIKDARKQGFIAIAKGGSTLANIDPATGRVTDFGGRNNAGTVDPVTGAVTVGLNKRKSISARSAKEVGAMPIELFKQIEMYDEISPAMLEERIKAGVDPADYPGIRLAIENHLGIAPGTNPNAYPNALDGNRWVKWIKGSSVHASNIF